MDTEAEATATLGDDRSEWPEVAIIVLNWNNYEDTAKCLESLESVRYPNYKVIVVDNNSTDGSAKRLEEEFDWCEFIFNSENLGFAGGNNVGIESAIDYECEYIMLLNNDIVVTEDFLTPLVCEIDQNDEVGVVSSVIRRTGSNEIWFAGGRFFPKFVKTTQWGTVKDEKSPYESQHATGALLLIDRELVKDIGDLKEEYFFAMEDTDFCYRARTEGWKVLIVPSSVVLHKVGGSSGEGTPFRYYHATRNRLYFSSNYLNTPQYILFIVYFVTSRIVLLPKWIVKNPTIIHSIILGIYDHLLNNKPRQLEYFN